MLGPHLGVIVGEDREVYRYTLRIRVAWEQLDWVSWAGGESVGIRIVWFVGNGTVKAKM